MIDAYYAPLDFLDLLYADKELENVINIWQVQLINYIKHQQRPPFDPRIPAIYSLFIAPLHLIFKYGE
jgi:hypothetical protein